MALKILRTDKYHGPVAFVFREPKALEMVSLEMKDRAEKHIVLRELARHLGQGKKVRSVVLINEAWWAPFDGTFEHAANRPDRREALCLYGITSEGECFNLAQVFERLEGQIWFPSNPEANGRLPNLMQPIAAALVRSKRRPK